VRCGAPELSLERAQLPRLHDVAVETGVQGYRQGFAQLARLPQGTQRGGGRRACQAPCAARLEQTGLYGETQQGGVIAEQLERAIRVEAVVERIHQIERRLTVELEVRIPVGYARACCVVGSVFLILRSPQPRAV